jgi:outer membrane receptor protein involved in Fe transport
MDDWTFRAGVQNLFDEEPPLAGSGEARFGTAAAYLYDLVGRRYFASVSKRW